MASQRVLPLDLSPDAIEQQLERMLASDTLQRCGRLSRFLRFTVGEALAGRTETVTEYNIGRQVFDRREDFDGRYDPVVRVEAGRLRSKVLQYYLTQGAIDPVFVGLQKRGYLPLIESREVALSRREVRKQEEDSGLCIAVLPFRDLSVHQNHAPLCEGITREILTGLIRQAGFTVIGQRLSRSLQVELDDFAATTSALGLREIVEGSVQREGNRVRISVEVANVETGRSTWAESFDRELDNVFELQRELADEIVLSLRRILLTNVGSVAALSAS